MDYVATVVWYDNVRLWSMVYHVRLCPNIPILEF